MKSIKRIFALGLIACLLIGTSLLIRPARAVDKPEEIRLLRADRRDGKYLDVYFSASLSTASYNAGFDPVLCVVDETGAVMSAGVSLRFGGKLFWFDANGDVTRDQTKFAPSEAHHMRFELTDKKTVGGAEIADIDAILALTAEGGAAEGGRVVLRLEEKGAGAVQGSGKLETATLPGDTGVCLKADAAVAGAYDTVSCEITEPLTVTDITCYNDKQFVVSFSEPIARLGGEYVAVRLVDENNTLQYADGDAKKQPYQWTIGSLQYYGKNAAETGAAALYGTLSKNANFPEITTFSAIQAIAEEKGYLVRLSFEESANGKTLELGGRKLTAQKKNGLVDNIVALASDVATVWDGASGYETLTRRLNSDWYWSSDRTYTPIEAVTEAVTMDSVRAVARDTVEVAFSEPVALDRMTDNPAYFIRVVDAKNNGITRDGVGLSWDCKIIPTSDPKVFQFKINSYALGCRNLDDILSLPLNEGESVKFGVGQTIPKNTANVPGLVDNVSSLDGKKLLLSNRDWDGAYLPIEGIGSDKLEMTRAELLNDNQIKVSFSDPISFEPRTPWLSLRLVNTDEALVYDKTEDRNTPVQFQGTWEWADESHTSFIWTFNADTPTNELFGVYNITDVLNFKAGLSGLKDAGVFKFGIEEVPVEGSFEITTKNGKVDNVISADFRLLEATFTRPNSRNAAYAPVACEYDITPLTADVVQLDESSLVITFSSPVDWIGNPYVGIRMLREEGGGLLSVERDGQKIYMQWSGRREWLDEEHTQLKWTLNPNQAFGVTNLSELMGYSAEKGLDEFKQYPLAFCIEETPCAEDTNNTFIKADGKISNIYKAGTTLRMDATRRVKNAYDGFYGAIQWLDYDPTTLTLKSVKVLDHSSLELTFSEPIVIAPSKGMFPGIRYVDKETGSLLWDGERNTSTALQWYGTFSYLDEEQTRVKWTLNSKIYNSSLGAVLNFLGDLEQFKDRADIRFCIEEGPFADPEQVLVTGNGLIDNISALNRMKMLSANRTFSAGSRDGLYLPIEGSLPDRVVSVSDFEIISDIQARISFSEPVRIFDRKGEESNNASNPFLALRLVDEANNLLYVQEEGKESKTPMQWAGKWTWDNEEHTAIRWTFSSSTYNVTSLIDLLNYTGLEEFQSDYRLKFCIEELGTPQVFQNALIDNIVAADDDNVRLSVNKAGRYDGLYLDFDLGNFRPRTLTASINVVNDSQLDVIFSEPVALRSDALPYIALCYTKDGELMWTGEKSGLGIALQWEGTWKWLDESHTGIRWTFKGGSRFGANNLYDVMNFTTTLSQYAGEGVEVQLRIEEKDYKNYPIYRKTGTVDNVTTLDGQIHLQANTGSSLDCALIPVRTNLLYRQPQLLSARAIDEKTLEIRFSEKVLFGNGELEPSLGIRLVTSTGAFQKALDGRNLVLKGDYEWKDDTTMIWTLKKNESYGVSTLSDIFNFENDMSWYKDSTIVFSVMDPSTIDSVYYWDGLVNTVLATDGIRKLGGNAVSQTGVAMVPIEIAYELPAPSGNGTEKPADSTDPLIRTVEVQNYVPFIILAAVVLAAGVAAALVIAGKKGKHAGKETK